MKRKTYLLNTTGNKAAFTESVRNNIHCNKERTGDYNKTQQQQQQQKLK